MKIYIIRHGETDWNKARRLQGQSDISLNENGKKLAKRTAEALKEVPFTKAFSSPLSRAMETANIILEGRQIDVIADNRLLEISFGEYEGLCNAKDNYNIPDPDFHYFFDEPERYKVPNGGESISSLCERTTEFLNELIHNKACANDIILVATHGAAVRGLLSSIKGNSIAQFWNGGFHKNCAVSLLDVKDGVANLVEEGKTYY